MPTLYDRSVAELMSEAASVMRYPASRGDFVAWFAERYPKVKASTVQAHVTGLTENDRNRHHYAWLARRPALFVRTPDGQLTRFADVESDDVESEIRDGASSAPPLEFALEAYLEEFLLSNWILIDWGRPLELWESNAGEIGHQLPTPVGRLDFLCHDTDTGELVVVELKRGRPSDRVVRQIARYMGWVQAQLAAEEQPVKGLIIAHEQDLQLSYAVAAVPDLSVLTYRIEFALSAPHHPDGD